MKKFLIVIAALTMALAVFGACSSKTTATNTGNETDNSSDTTGNLEDNGSQDGVGAAKPYGIDVTLRDSENKKIYPDASVFRLSSGVTYTVEFSFKQSGGSAFSAFTADAINFEYDEILLEVVKCNPESENDVTYFIKNANSSNGAKLKVTVGEFSTEMTFSFN